MCCFMATRVSVSAPPKEGEVTTGPIYRSNKHYDEVAFSNDFGEANLRIPVRRINLTDGTHFDAYDTSGIYTEENPELNLKEGLAKTRDSWPKASAVPAVAGSEEAPKVKTQLAWARA